MTVLEALETEQVSAYYDEAKNIVFVVYRNQLNPASTKLAYEWIAKYASVATRAAYGCIFDFGAVTSFGGHNFAVVREERRKVNASQNYSQIPVALIAETMLQEQIAYTSLKLAEKSDRFRVVKDLQDALAFIDEWHQKHP